MKWNLYKQGNSSYSKRISQLLFLSSLKLMERQGAFRAGMFYQTFEDPNKTKSRVWVCDLFRTPVGGQTHWGSKRATTLFLAQSLKEWVTHKRPRSGMKGRFLQGFLTESENPVQDASAEHLLFYAESPSRCIAYRALISSFIMGTCICWEAQR